MKVAADPLGFDLVDTNMIATRCGVTIHAVRQWRKRHDDFPQPITRLGNVPVWNWPDVEQWQQKREPGGSRSRHQSQ